MAKMYFGKTVRYNGISFPPNTTFEVLDSEVEELRKVGGWVEEPEVVKEPVKEPVKESKAKKASK